MSTKKNIQAVSMGLTAYFLLSPVSKALENQIVECQGLLLSGERSQSTLVTGSQDTRVEREVALTLETLRAQLEAAERNGEYSIQFTGMDQYRVPRSLGEYQAHGNDNAVWSSKERGLHPVRDAVLDELQRRGLIVFPRMESVRSYDREFRAIFEGYRRYWYEIRWPERIQPKIIDGYPNQLRLVSPTGKSKTFFQSSYPIKAFAVGRESEAFQIDGRLDLEGEGGDQYIFILDERSNVYMVEVGFWKVNPNVLPQEDFFAKSGGGDLLEISTRTYDGKLSLPRTADLKGGLNVVLSSTAENIYPHKRLEGMVSVGRYIIPFGAQSTLDGKFFHSVQKPVLFDSNIREILDGGEVVLGDNFYQVRRWVKNNSLTRKKSRRSLPVKTIHSPEGGVPRFHGVTRFSRLLWTERYREVRETVMTLRLFSWENRVDVLFSENGNLVLEEIGSPMRALDERDPWLPSTVELESLRMGRLGVFDLASRYIKDFVARTH